MTGDAPVPPDVAPTAPPAAPTAIPWLGLLAVLMGTFISTLNTRLSTFGLADIRGAVHAGFDEGAWITTAQAVAQMLIAPAAVWMGSVYGPRRVLMGAALAFAVISLVTPMSNGLPMLLCLHRRLCPQLGILAEHFGLARGMVCRPSHVAMDFLAEHTASAHHRIVARPGDEAKGAKSRLAPRRSVRLGLPAGWVSR